jgi:MoaA/NifB/PqqE/SkfB family radical SAM enzyme
MNNRTVKPLPTKRAVIDIGRICNLNCNFCYYHHSDSIGHKSLDVLKKEALAAKDRGNITIDLYGGEPTMLPFIEEFLLYLKSLNLNRCIITNGVVPPNKVLSILDSGVEEFNVSLHGGEATHDLAVGMKGARKKQERFLSMLKARGVPFSFNSVLTRDTAPDIPIIVDMALKWRPEVVNFINFNPNYGWADDPEGTRKNVADLFLAAPLLDDAIGTLEESSIAANLRFYPMCRISEKNRKNVCNTLHISFDPTEWDYKIKPKTVEAHLRWGRTLSKLKENKQEPCNKCSLHNICGGINIHFHEATNKKMATAVNAPTDCDPNDFYHYRKHCVLSLDR